MLKSKCSWCGKVLIIGHDRYFTVGIHFQDPSGHSIYDKSELKQYENYCEKCKNRAEHKFKILIKKFNER